MRHSVRPRQYGRFAKSLLGPGSSLATLARPGHVREVTLRWVSSPQGSEYRAVMDAFAHCENLVREADKDRFLAGLFAPAEKRRGLFALYAFNAEVAGGQGKSPQPLSGQGR